ncbi:MAG: ABC transporter substrate-binding protein [Anaerolineae bacterium]|nr:MAG: ABC transporter substrate-binding protein [Anaerolineae bacterium]
MKIYCDPLAGFVEIPEKPRRIVSLASGLTEALVHMGFSRLIAGVSVWCPNFTPELEAPIVGDYLSVDEEKLSAVQPDLLLITTGVQRGLARKLYKAGLPIYVLPLQNSLHGIFENIMTLGALLDALPAARALITRWQQTFAELHAQVPHPRPRVYAEIWFGRHVRMTGGLTFIHDLIEAAGGENLFGDVRKGYLELDLAEVERRRPDIFLVYSEPELPIQAVDLARERGWNIPLIQADISPAHNIIHDGPSMMRAARWLHGEIRRAAQETR